MYIPQKYNTIQNPHTKIPFINNLIQSSFITCIIIRSKNTYTSNYKNKGLLKNCLMKGLQRIKIFFHQNIK